MWISNSSQPPGGCVAVPHLQAGHSVEFLLPIQDLTNHRLQQRDSQLPADLCWQLGVGKHHLAAIDPAGE